MNESTDSKKLRFENKPAFVEHERLLMETHDLKDLSIEIQESIQETWDALDSDERARLHGLSADLYMISGNEILEHTDLSSEHLSQALTAAWNAKDSPRFLCLLRKGPKGLSQDQIAYLRWRHYGHLGHKSAALKFLLHAIKLNPKPNYYCCLLQFLINIGKRQEAREMAAKLVFEKQTHPNLVIMATAVLFQEEQPPYSILIGALRDALKREEQLPGKHLLKARTLGLILLGLCYEQLNKNYRAMIAFGEALSLDPEDEEVFRRLSNLRYSNNPNQELDQLAQQIKNGTKLGWPYYRLALRAMEETNYSKCMELCNQGLPYIRQPYLKADMLNWLAICKAELGYSHSEVGGLLQEALKLVPNDQHILHNIVVWNKETSQTWDLNLEKRDPNRLPKQYLAGISDEHQKEFELAALAG